MDLSARLALFLALIALASVSTAEACEVGDSCADARRATLAEQRRHDDEHARDQLRDGETLYEHLRLTQHFEFRPGDVLLLRSDELIAAAISQIALTPAFFSHVAIVAVDPQWQTLEVVEAGVDEGLRAIPLDDWLDRSAVRFAVYRHRDPQIAERAALAAFADLGRRRGEDLVYDLKFDLDDATQLYCSEVITRAFAAAAPDAPRVPQTLSKVGSLVETFPLSALGVTASAVFMPDDLESDPRFERVLERRTPAALARNAAVDEALRAVFETLRGPQRDVMLAELDGAASSPLKALPMLLRGSFNTWRRLPEPARSRLAALALKVDEDARQRLATIE